MCVFLVHVRVPRFLYRLEVAEDEEGPEHARLEGPRPLPRLLPRPPWPTPPPSCCHAHADHLACTVDVWLR